MARDDSVGPRLWGSTWRRGLPRVYTAYLLILGGSIALITSVAIFYVNNDQWDAALSEGKRLLVAVVGLVLVFGSIVGLLIMSASDGRMFRWLVTISTAEGGQAGPAAELRPAAAGDASQEIAMVDSKPVVYYLVVASMVLGFWILTTSTGGYIKSPLGLIFTSVVLFGQIRADTRPDMLLLFGVGIAGCASSDLIVHHGWFSNLFTPTNDLKVDPVSWYFAVVLSLFVSTAVNLATGRFYPTGPAARSDSDGATP